MTRQTGISSLNGKNILTDRKDYQKKLQADYGQPDF